MEHKDDEGWLPNPGYQPVDGDVKVDVVFVDGANYYTAFAAIWDWVVENHNSDISYWRLHSGKWY